MPEENTGQSEPQTLQAKLKAERIQNKLKAERIQSKLKAERIQFLLEEVPGWEPSEDARSLQRTYHLPTLQASGLFVQLVLAIGEADGNVPEITVRHLEVTVDILTSQQEGVTEIDFNLARLIDSRL